ncbi:MurR/RpiR family transcriptional regulator [Alicyclobacillus shizuokensis]|uniref:MurR/RpiR family transcriptional regulator n=1 Tax=Alicyclobacillus shizuokensis TaxID=392014 RepID=UPI00082D1310|nr:MurR/RpiR family transcriptional regulator [Alicyclobacillus shizuokensis]MCL6625114.1 MurR/RpiR family transcriptional regulator [Alicyclobacillus shizuokensis]
MNKAGTGQRSLTMISSVYPSLSKAEQKVADAVLADAETTVYSSVTDLAEKAGVGETTVIRFCRKLGYRGFQEFKLAVAQDLVSPSQHVHGRIEDSDDVPTMAEKITAHNTQTLQDTHSLLQEAELEKACSALARCQRVMFFGVGSSGITAADAKYRFMRLGFHADCASDAHVIAMNASMVTPEDVVVGITTSGSTKDLVDAVKMSKQNGAYVICITNHARSPITQYADAILLGAAKETPLQGGAFSSKLAQIHVLDILSTVVAMRHRESAFRSLNTTAKSVLDKLY